MIQSFPVTDGKMDTLPMIYPDGSRRIENWICTMRRDAKGFIVFPATDHVPGYDWKQHDVSKLKPGDVVEFGAVSPSLSPGKLDQRLFYGVVLAHHDDEILLDMSPETADQAMELRDKLFPFLPQSPHPVQVRAIRAEAARRRAARSHDDMVPFRPGPATAALLGIER